MISGLEKLSLLGTVLSGVNQAVAIRQEANAQSQLAVFQANILRTNKAIADNAAFDAMRRGYTEANEYNIKTAQTVGDQRAVFAARGLQVDDAPNSASASTGTVVAETVGLGALDADTILANAEREALTFRQRGEQFEREARVTEMTGQSRSRAGNSRVGSTLMTTAFSVADKWRIFN